jgi:hypothetical protein
MTTTACSEMTRTRTTSSSRRSLWRTSNGDIDLHYRNWADWAPAEGSRDGQTEFEWTDHKFQRFTDALASRLEELGEQMSELALQEGSQDESRMEREVATSLRRRHRWFRAAPRT